MILKLTNLRYFIFRKKRHFSQVLITIKLFFEEKLRSVSKNCHMESFKVYSH